MHSYDGMLAKCQQIYSEYLNHNSILSDSGQLIAEVEQMLLNLQPEIHHQIEAGTNTALLEKVQQDLLDIRKELTVENSSVSGLR
jgi:hypothetical protein